MRREMVVLLIPHGAPTISIQDIAADYVFEEIAPGDWRTRKSRIGLDNVLLVTAGRDEFGRPNFTRPVDA